MKSPKVESKEQKRHFPLLSDGWLAFSIFILSLTLYTFLPILYPPEPSILDDSLEYALQAESNNLSELFHPHHLLNAAFHRLIWLILGDGHSTLRVIYLMRWTSHITMALSVMLLFLLARRVGASKPMAAIVGWGFATGCSPWIFGSVAEVVAPSCAAFLFIMLLLFYQGGKTRLSLPRLWLSGLLMGTAITWSQIVAIYTPVIWIFLLLQDHRQKWRNLFHFTAVLFTWVAASYLIVVYGILNGNTPMDLYNFLTFYAHKGLGGSGITWNNPVAAIRTLLITQSYSFLSPESLFTDIWSGLATLGSLALAGLGLYGWVRGETQSKYERLAVAIFGFISIGFILWWLPSAWDYWVLPWAVLLLGIARIRHLKLHILVPGIAVVFLITALYNFSALVLPRMSDTDNPYYNLSQSIGKLPPLDRTGLFTTDIHLYHYARYWAEVPQPFHYIEIANGVLPVGKQAEFMDHLAKLRVGETNALLVDGDVLHDTLLFLDNQHAQEKAMLNSARLIASQYYGNQIINVYLVTR